MELNPMEQFTVKPAFGLDHPLFLLGGHPIYFTNQAFLMILVVVLSALFLTFAVLILDKEAGAMGRAREYANLYNELPREAAQRTLRFWRLRRSSIEQAA